MADKKISALTAATTPLAGTEVLPIVQGTPAATVKVSVANLTAGRAVSTGALSVVAGNATLDNGYFLNGKLVAGTSVGMLRRNSSDKVAIDEDGYGVVMGFGGRYSFAGGGDFTTNIGNIIFGAAAKGVNFTANTPAAGMTSQLLNWYEEGTWTPLISINGAGATNFTTVTATGYYVRVGKLVTLTCLYEYSSIGSVGNDYGFMSGLPITSANNATPAVSAVQMLQTAFDTKNYQGVVLANTKLIAFQYNNGAGTLYVGAPYMVGNTFPGAATVKFVISYICA